MFHYDPVLQPLKASHGPVEEVLRSLYDKAMVELLPQKKKLDLSLSFQTKKWHLYGKNILVLWSPFINVLTSFACTLKRFCDIDLGVASQCCFAWQGI
jgi:hypothetical protein